MTGWAVSAVDVALAPGTALLAIGASDGSFATTWNASHFTQVPRADSG